MPRHRRLGALFALLVLVTSLVSTGSGHAQTVSPGLSAVVNVTILHTNDFHGNLEVSGSNPGIARLATKIKEVRTAVGTSNTLLLDGGDEMQGSLLSNLKKGAPTIDLFNALGYDAATFGNHEFDWGQDTLKSRISEAAYPFVAANLVTKDTASCDTAGWTAPSFAQPWIMKTVGATGNQAKIAIIGVTTQETPYITIAAATQGLCFKDPAESIKHYYAEIKAAGANAVVVLSHLGNTDGGYGYGFPVYGDQTLAKKLADGGAPVSLIIGGHSHTNLTAAQVVSGIPVVQAYYAGRNLGRADLAIDTTAGTTSVTWQSLVVNATDASKAFTVAEDAATKTRLATWTSDAAYQAQIGEVVGYTATDLVRDYNGDSLMGEFIQDAIYNDLNTDATAANDADMVFNNPGGIRADIVRPVGFTEPYTLTYGAVFSVLPFGNQTVVGDMTGAQLMELLNQSASLFKGAIQPSGIKFSYYVYSDTLGLAQPWAWGAYDVQVKNRTSGAWEPLQLTKTYRVATNEFLAPAGQDGFTAFKYMRNITYWGDMLDGVIRWSKAHYTQASPYNGPNGNGTIDGRITRNGTGVYDPNNPNLIVPVTILHHNDSHGRLAKTVSGSTTTVGLTQLATVIKQERQHNPDRTILLQAGDNIQGDSMMYYFKSAALGYAADGTPLSGNLTTHPMMAAMNALGYTAMTLGNHEFNFGKDVFVSTLKQATFPILQANLSDNGSYGLAGVPVQASVSKTLPGPAGAIKLAILGVGNHRIPNYELPSNIPGLTFTNPISDAQARVPALRSANDVVVALTHIGFTTNPKSVEVDSNVDTNLAAEVTGVDAIIGGHSHTDPSKQSDASGDYQYLPALVAGPNNTPVIINQAYRYNTYLGETILGLRPRAGGGYEVVARAGRDIAVPATTEEDAAIKAIVDPYTAQLNAYNAKQVGQTTAPIDTLNAFTAETNGANLQADAAVWELAQHNITVDFHLSGAMTNKKVADAATPASPVALTVSDMFAAMPYENSLVALRMNGPQLKAVLERAYRNYYYYKYVPGYGGYSYYTTCMLDVNAGGTITYRDTYPLLPNGSNVESLVVNGNAIDFTDTTKYYTVSTVNYLAAGSCNFSDNGVSLWPLSQIVADTQYYVRDAVIDYVTSKGTVSPAVEGRLSFKSNFSTAVGAAGGSLVYTGTNGLAMDVQIPAGAISETVSLVFAPFAPSSTSHPAGLAFAGQGFELAATRDNSLLEGFTFAKPIVVTIRYSDATVAQLNERALTLSYWDGSAWADAACGAYERNLEQNQLTVPICHLSRFSLFATPRIYLPLARR
ncbi:MAG: hypothetical protein HGA45_14155 [Chloroflexales bacterium]|nr:hypothetical protein [Chloroflexales bacterium]